MITINDCLNFKHKYEIAPDGEQSPVNALPRDVLKFILSYLWVGLRTKEVCKSWNEYFVEVLKQDEVWRILARVLELPDSRSLFIRRLDLIGHLRNLKTKDLEFYEWYFEHAIQSSFFENVFGIVRNCGKGFGPLIQLNALDEVLAMLANNTIGEISKKDAEALCGKLVLRGDIEKAMAVAKSLSNGELHYEIAKALFRLDHYSRSLEIAKDLEPKNKGFIYGLNAFRMLQIGEEEKGMILANMTAKDSSCAKAYAFRLMALICLDNNMLGKACEMMEKMETFNDGSSDLKWICDGLLVKIAKAFHIKGDRERAAIMVERFHNYELKRDYKMEFNIQDTPRSCVLM